MKKSIFSIAMCVSVLLIVSSCSHDDLMSDEVVPQKTESSASGSTMKAGIQTKSFSATNGSIGLWSQPFTSISLSGNTKIVVTITNTGSGTASATLSSTGYFNDFIYIPNVSPGTSRVYTYTISGWTGSPKVEVQCYNSGSASGSITVQSF